MPALLIASPQSLAGKTTVAVGLAQRLGGEGHRTALSRLAGDDHAPSDAATFSSLPGNAYRQGQPLDPSTAAGIDADYVLIEAPAGDPATALAAIKAATVIAVARYSPAHEAITDFCRSLGDKLLALVLTCVPATRRDAVREAFAGLPLLTLLPEDRALAAPTLEDAVAALEASATHLNDSRQLLLERPLISSISADPAQGYFARYDPSAVIVRGDKPDLQLAALNAGAPCLIVTSGLPLLSYVSDRAEEEEIPILQTALDTVATVQRLEGLYAATPFSGPAKAERIAQLMAEVDLSPLTKKKRRAS